MRSLKLFNLLLVLTLALSACGKSARSITYRIDPSLRDYYATLGGKNLLGPAISELFTYNTNQCQYVVSALLCIDPDDHTFLYSLGSTLINTQSTTTETSASTSLAVGGIPVYEEFIPLYKELSGASITGLPLAQARMNYTRQRVEQYFENIGFYRNFSDKPGNVKLLAYGAAACSTLCKFTPAVGAAIDSSAIPETDRAFLAGLEKIGDASIFGTPLTRAFLASDGMLEQVFQNAALYTTPGSSVIHLRPVPVIIGKPSTPPGPKLFGNKEGMVFFAVDGKLGYHVPQLFDDFISAHGGTAISGMPIAEVSEDSPGVYRQCFENYCLLYTPAAEPTQQLILEALGSDYLARISPADINGETVVISPSTVSLRVKEQFVLLQPKQTQKIEVSLNSQLDNQPMTGIAGQLVINRPDGTTWSAEIPATLGNGKSSVNVPFLEHVPNASIMRYEVCLTGIIAEPVCATGSYVQMKLP